jgi:hypothetical protein
MFLSGTRSFYFTVSIKQQQQNTWQQFGAYNFNHQPPLILLCQLSEKRQIIS